MAAILPGPRAQFLRPIPNAGSGSSVLLVGSIPRPVGGVTQHVWRLATQLAPLGSAVLDLHPGPDKYPLPSVQLHPAPSSRLIRLPWLLKQLRESPARVVHLHVSGPRLLAWGGSWLRAACRDKRLVLTLHHGDQAKLVRQMNRLMQRRLRRSLESCDRILCLSEAQQRFFQDQLGISGNRLQRATSYLSIPAETLAAISIGVTQRAPADVAQRGCELDEQPGEVLLVASGYAEPSYRHEWALRLSDRLRASCDARLVLCLYGQVREPAYLAWLQSEARKRTSVKLQFGLDFIEFLQLQSRADLFLRPNQIDSCGIAVWDAATLGIATVASDVCPRPPGCVTFSSDSYEAFESAALQTLQAKKPRRSQVLTDSLAAILQAYDLPDSLPRACTRAA